MPEAAHQDLPRVSPYYLGVLAAHHPWHPCPFPSGTPEYAAWHQALASENTLKNQPPYRPPLGMIV